MNFTESLLMRTDSHFELSCPHLLLLCILVYVSSFSPMSTKIPPAILIGGNYTTAFNALLYSMSNSCLNFSNLHQPESIFHQNNQNQYWICSFHLFFTFLLFSYSNRCLDVNKLCPKAWESISIPIFFRILFSVISLISVCLGTCSVSFPRLYVS